MIRKYTVEKEERGTGAFVMLGTIQVAGCFSGGNDSQKNVDGAERIAACLNACDGIDDPTVIIPRVVADIAIAEEKIKRSNAIISAVVLSLRKEGLNEFADSVVDSVIGGASI